MSTGILRISVVLVDDGAAVGSRPAARAVAPRPGAVGTNAGHRASHSTVDGRIDFGVRGTTLDGDAARYERYRDLGDGLFLESRR